jgi:hypothetical protein
MSKGNPFLALRLPLDQQDALRTRAAESGLSVSELVRQAVAKFVGDTGLRTASPDKRTRGINSLSRPSKQSRPARLQAAISELEDLLADYENWQASVPESLQETGTAAALNDAVDLLQQAVALLQQITVPRGFGRD